MTIITIVWVFLLYSGAILLTIALDSQLQHQCTMYWSRAKEKPFWLRCWHISFFTSVMLPTRCLQPWIMYVAAPGTFCAAFALSNPVVALSFLLWVGLIMENITLGIVYHNTVLGKRYLDTIGLGPDMILYFWKYGDRSVCSFQTCFTGKYVCVGSIIVEKVIIDACTFGDTLLEESRHKGSETYDFNKNWNMKKNRSYDKAIFQNLVAYLKGK